MDCVHDHVDKREPQKPKPAPPKRFTDKEKEQLYADLRREGIFVQGSPAVLPKVPPTLTFIFYYWTVIVYVACLYLEASEGPGSGAEYAEGLMNDHLLVVQGHDFIRLLTAPFAHRTPWAMFITLIALGTIASTLEATIGYFAFASLAVLGAVTSGIADVLIDQYPVTQGALPVIATFFGALVIHEARNGDVADTGLQNELITLHKEAHQLTNTSNSNSSQSLTNSCSSSSSSTSSSSSSLTILPERFQDDLGSRGGGFQTQGSHLRSFAEEMGNESRGGSSSSERFERSSSSSTSASTGSSKEGSVGSSSSSAGQEGRGGGAGLTAKGPERSSRNVEERGLEERRQSGGMASSQGGGAQALHREGRGMSPGLEVVSRDSPDRDFGEGLGMRAGRQSLSGSMDSGDAANRHGGLHTEKPQAEVELFEGLLSFKFDTDRATRAAVAIATSLLGCFEAFYDLQKDGGVTVTWVGILAGFSTGVLLSSGAGPQYRLTLLTLEQAAGSLKKGSQAQGEASGQEDVDPFFSEKVAHAWAGSKEYLFKVQDERPEWSKAAFVVVFSLLLSLGVPALLAAR